MTRILHHHYEDTDYTAVAAFDFADGSGLVSEDLTEHNLDLTFNNGITRTDDGVNLNSVGGSIKHDRWRHDYRYHLYLP